MLLFKLNIFSNYQFRNKLVNKLEINIDYNIRLCLIFKPSHLWDASRIWRNREIPIPLKKKLVQLMIWPIMSYGSETWIYLKSVQNMINVFERWCYRRMLRISWTEHVTNEEVFNRANTKPTLLDELLKRRLAFHGHLVRKGGITLDLMIGRLHGTRPRGRPRTTWLKDLTTHANISYKESMTIPRDRKKWRSVGNPRRTPDE